MGYRNTWTNIANVLQQVVNPIKNSSTEFETIYLENVAYIAEIWGVPNIVE